jgi:hypothetical protein
MYSSRMKGKLFSLSSPGNPEKRDVPRTMNEPSRKNDDDPIGPEFRVWCTRFSTEPATVLEAVDRWKELFERSGESALSEGEEDDLEVLTYALTSYLDNHPTSKIDPAPLMSLLDALLDRNESERDRVRREAKAVLVRLRLLAVGAGMRREADLPVMSEIEAEAAFYIREHEGCLGKEVANGVCIAQDHFRKIFVRALRPRGYRNVRRLGYFPPVKDRDG